MAVSGWYPLLILLGIIPLVVVERAFDGTVNSYAVLGGWLALCLILGVLDLMLAAPARRLVIERRPIAKLRLGEGAIAELVVWNPSGRALRGVLRDAWEPSAGAIQKRVILSIPGGETRLASTQLVPFRRGERISPHVTIRAYGPLRLWGRQATHAVPGQVRVLPAFNSRKHLPSLVARLKELDGKTLTMVRGQGSEFDSLREYVRGDDVRSIDWRATARRDEVVVRTWRPERDRRVILIVDSARTSAARIDNEPRIDSSFEASLLLAALADRAGDRVDFMVYDQRMRARVRGTSGQQLLSSMVDAMAPIIPNLIEMDWSAIPRLVRQLTTHKSLVVILTTADSPGVARPLLAMLPGLSAKHLVVVAGVSDPAIEEDALVRTGRDEVFRATAAERAMADRRRVEAAIRLCGAHSITATPQQLPPKLSQYYLSLKAAGKL